MTDTPETTAHDLAAGHWDSAAGQALAQDYAEMSRADLTHGEISDFALANRVFMAGRDDLDLIVWQTAAKERIRWLSAQLAIRPTEQLGQQFDAARRNVYRLQLGGERLCEALRQIVAGEGNPVEIAKAALNNKAADPDFSALTASEAKHAEALAREARLLAYIATLPCATKGVEDLEGGCCEPCRARTALSETPGASSEGAE